MIMAITTWTDSLESGCLRVVLLMIQRPYHNKSAIGDSASYYIKDRIDSGYGFYQLG